MRIEAASYALVLLALLLAWPPNEVAAQPPSPRSVDVTFRANPTGKKLQRELVVTLRSKVDGKPLVDAIVHIDVDMPSMPMMHRVPQVQARPGEVPGEYRARVNLEMAGEWAARITVKSPLRLNVVRKFNVSGGADSSKE